MEEDEEEEVVVAGLLVVLGHTFVNRSSGERLKERGERSA